MKKTWEGIRELIGHQRKSCKSINALRDNRSSPLVYEPDKIANIMNSHTLLYVDIDLLQSCRILKNIIQTT